MKKIFYFASVAMMALVAALNLTSCDNDDDDKKKLLTSSIVDVNYTFSDDFYELFNVAITVTDFEGNTETLNVTENGQKRYSIKSKDAVAKVAYNCTPKEGVTVDDARSYDFAAACYVNCYVVSGVDKILSSIAEGSKIDAYNAIKTNNVYGADLTINGWKNADEEALPDLKELFTKSVEFTLNFVDGEIQVTEE